MEIDDYSSVLVSDKKQLLDYKKAFDSNDSSKNIDRLEWMHFKNPIQSPMVSITYSNQLQVASIYAVMPLYFKIDTVVHKACQSIDTLTDENHRGKGLFVKSANSLYENAINQGYAFVYGFPNGNSVHGFTKKLNWKLLDPVPFLFKPFKTGYFLKKIFGNAIGNILNFNISSTKKIKLADNEEIIEINKFSRDSDTLWENFSSHFKVAINRNSEYLNWRFVDKPQEKYQKIGFYRDGKLLGFIIYTHKKKHGGNIAYIMELITYPQEMRVGKILLQYAINYFIVEKADLLLSWCFHFSPNFKVFKVKGFFDLPEKLRPIELHFGYANFNADESIISRKENWYLSYADSDTV